MENSEKIKMYTDGACKGNPGIGGWGVLIQDSKTETELNGFSLSTTNNKMELNAVIMGLKSFNSRRLVTVITDSQYVKNGISQCIINWKSNGWRTASKKPVKNQELWKTLDSLVQKHDVHWEWVRGHSGHPGNERADQLANKGIEEHLQNITLR